jgi:hypothetical protein
VAVMVDKAARGMFSEFLGLFLQLSFYQLLHILLSSSGAATIYELNCNVMINVYALNRRYNNQNMILVPLLTRLFGGETTSTGTTAYKMHKICIKDKVVSVLN